jgi:hypothetical protein
MDRFIDRHEECQRFAAARGSYGQQLSALQQCRDGLRLDGRGRAESIRREAPQQERLALVPAVTNPGLAFTLLEFTVNTVFDTVLRRCSWTGERRRFSSKNQVDEPTGV